jgi:hypothetical protein
MPTYRGKPTTAVVTDEVMTLGNANAADGFSQYVYIGS